MHCMAIHSISACVGRGSTCHRETWHGEECQLYQYNQYTQDDSRWLTDCCYLSPFSMKHVSQWTALGAHKAPMVKKDCEISFRSLCVCFFLLFENNLYRFTTTYNILLIQNRISNLPKPFFLWPWCKAVPTSSSNSQCFFSIIWKQFT